MALVSEAFPHCRGIDTDSETRRYFLRGGNVLHWRVINPSGTLGKGKSIAVFSSDRLEPKVIRDIFRVDVKINRKIRS